MQNFVEADAPRCSAGFERTEIAAAPREVLRLKCIVDAEPSETVRFSWTYNGSRGDVSPIPNSRAQNKGLISVLEYVPTVDGDYGTLACWASNNVGRQRTPCTFNVVQASESPEFSSFTSFYSAHTTVCLSLHLFPLFPSDSCNSQIFWSCFHSSIFFLSSNN